jgi:hypothetical protein
MYCTKCELEIKGEDNDACPICDSPLVENSMEQQFSNVETPDDLKIRELIEELNSI